MIVKEKKQCQKKCNIALSNFAAVQEFDTSYDI